MGGKQKPTEVGTSCTDQFRRVPLSLVTLALSVGHPLYKTFYTNAEGLNVCFWETGLRWS